MVKYTITVLFALGLAVMAWGMTGFPTNQEALDVTTAAVCTITSTVYQAASGHPMQPCLIQTHGAGYYSLDPYASITASDFTPTVTAGYHCANGDIIEVDNPKWFRIIAAVADFSAFVTSFQP